jgi:ferredoxin/flavodoxin---NADP+ reductase
MQNYKVAIVGAGPAGYFAAQALQNLQTDDLQFSIDMIERLPTPWGLVRSGVAPDHPKIKTVAKYLKRSLLPETSAYLATLNLAPMFRSSS